MAMKNHPLKPLWFPSHGHNGRSDLPKLEPQWGQIKCQWGRKQVKMYTIAACRALKITTPKSVFSYIFPVLYAIAPPKKKTRCSQRFSQQVTIPVGWFSSSQLLIGLIGDLLERMKWNACARARRIKWIVEIWWGMIVLYNSYSQTLMLCWDNFASYSSAPIYSIHTYIYIASMFAMFMIPGSKIDIHQTIPTLNGFLRFPTSMREV